MINHIDIVGNVKIFSPLRLKYFVAVLKSLVFLKDNCTIWLNIENGKTLVKPVNKLLKKLGYNNFKITAKEGYYGNLYMEMLEEGSSEYVMNLEDDHFFHLNSKDTFFDIINFAHKNDVDCIHGTFFPHLLDTYKNITKEYEFEHAAGLRLTNDVFNQLAWNEHTIYCGNNCVFKRKYALKHWGEKFESTRPHPFEKTQFTEEKALNIIVLKTEFFRPIDDDHGIPNTCCIKNSDNQKWTSVWGTVSTASMWQWTNSFKAKEQLKKTPIIRRFIKK